MHVSAQLPCLVAHRVARASSEDGNASVGQGDLLCSLACYRAWGIPCPGSGGEGQSPCCALAKSQARERRPFSGLQWFITATAGEERVSWLHIVHKIPRLLPGSLTTTALGKAQSRPTGHSPLRSALARPIPPHALTGLLALGGDLAVLRAIGGHGTGKALLGDRLLTPRAGESNRTGGNLPRIAGHTPDGMCGGMAADAHPLVLPARQS